MISKDVSFARILPEPGPTERSGGTTELSQFGSRWLTSVPPISQLLAVGYFPVPRGHCNSWEFPTDLSIEGHSTGNYAAKSPSQQNSEQQQL